MGLERAQNWSVCRELERAGGHMGHVELDRRQRGALLPLRTRHREHSAPARSPNGHSDHQSELLRQMAYGSEMRVLDGGSAARVYYIHRVTLSALAADTQYSALFRLVPMTCSQFRCKLFFCPHC